MAATPDLSCPPYGKSPWCPPIPTPEHGKVFGQDSKALGQDAARALQDPAQEAAGGSEGEKMVLKTHRSGHLDYSGLEPTEPAGCDSPHPTQAGSF